MSGTMIHAEPQARYRTKQAEYAPTFRYRKPAERSSRHLRRRDAVAELQELQCDYQAWLGALPPNIADGATADTLRAICYFVLNELENAVPP